LEVVFRTRKLKKEYTSSKDATKAYGLNVARKYIQRVNIIKNALDIDELLLLPGLRCHPLKGERRGQYALKLTGFYRLIFSLDGKQIEIVCIEEVSKHYGD
jgi:proteic killer suppression protein